MENPSTYWSNRQAKVRPLGASMKASPLLRTVIGHAVSLRASDDLFLGQMLERFRVRSVLDLACGGGKPALGRLGYTAGVDIEGAPLALAQQMGYDEVTNYRSPDYGFEISRQVDAVSCINLNAHVSPTTYETILRRGLRFLKPGGVVILCNEYDNDGLSYRLMKRINKARWQAMVERMEHHYLGFEVDFVQRLEQLGLRQVYRRPLIGGALPALHSHWFMRRRDPSSALGTVALMASDVPLSIYNTLECYLAARENHAFLVGHVFSV